MQSAWQANNMILNSSSISLTRYKSNFTSARAKEMLIRPKPFRGFRSTAYEGYIFHIYRHYESTGRFEGDDDGCNYFEDPSRGYSLNIRVSSPVQVEHMYALGKKDFKISAAKIKNEFCAGGEFKTYKEGRYMRTVNLSGDIAQWEGWEFLFGSVVSAANVASSQENTSSEKPFVCAMIILRRSYIPPLCDISQDIVISVRVNHDEMRALQMRPPQILTEARRIAAFVSPIDQSNILFKDLIKARMDSLAYPPDFYNAMKYRIKLEPIHVISARRYMVSLLTVIGDSYPLAYPEVVEEAATGLDASEPVAEDPKFVILQMVQNPCGLEDIPDDAPGKKERFYEWEQKVASFLTFYVDSGLCGFKFNLEDFMDALSLTFESEEGETDETDEVLRQQALFLLHARPRNPEQPYDPRALLAMLSPYTDPTRDFTFNEHVLSQVLLAGDCFEKLVWGKRFRMVPESKRAESSCTLLCSLLASKEVSESLKESICSLIVRAAAGESSEDTGLFRVTPSLAKKLSVSLCNLVRGMSSGGVLFVRACQALVNMGAQNSHVKCRVGSSGCAESILNILKNADDESALFSLLLLVQISKENFVRQILFECQAMISILEYLVNRFYTPNPKILRQAFMLMGTLLSSDEINKSMKNAKVPVKIVIYVIRDAELDRSDPATISLFAKGMYVLAKLLEVDHERRVIYGDEILDVLGENKLLMNALDEEFVAGSVMALKSLAASTEMVSKIKLRGLHKVIDRIRAIKSLCTEFLAERAMEFEKELQKSISGFR